MSLRWAPPIHTDRATPLRWLQMTWCQIGDSPSTTTMLLHYDYIEGHRYHVPSIKQVISERDREVDRPSVSLILLVGLDLFNDTRPSGHISRPTQVNVSQSCFHSLNNYSSPIILSRSGSKLKLTNYIISDRRIPLPAGIPLCKSQELSGKDYSTSQLCSIHHDTPVTLHTPRAYGQWSVFDHNGDKQLAVLGPRYVIWWPLYGQFEVGWLCPLTMITRYVMFITCQWKLKYKIETLYEILFTVINTFVEIAIQHRFAIVKALYVSHQPIINLAIYWDNFIS